MLKDLTKEMFAMLRCEYPPIAIKFSFDMPENTERIDKELALCAFVREAQVLNKKFYITAENENCVGRMILGMIDPPPLEGSGIAGHDFGVFRTPAANARLYHSIPMLKRGAHNYVTFCPVSICDFDPDIIIVIADVRQADIIMRANSFISGDLWESRDSHVLGCGWQFAYPYLSGKINHSTVGMHHGQKRRKPFPNGLQLISIPYQKIDEVTGAMSEMDWVTIAFREDTESKEELARRMAHWGELSSESVLSGNKSGGELSEIR